MTQLAPVSEAQLHEQVCAFIRLTWPQVIFWSDGSGNNLSRVQAARNTLLRSSAGIPDLFVAAPRGRYHGCFLELKRADKSPYLKTTGKLSTEPHIQQQAQVLQALADAGYWANFCVGYDEAVRLLRWYMNL